MTSSRSIGRVLVATLVVVAIGGLAVGGAVGDSPTVDDEGNETLHEHPDEIDEGGDDEDVADWLAGDLGERLGDSAIEISEGEYEQARDLLGDDYDDSLERYVEVAGDTDRETDDGEDRDERAVEEYERAKENQSELADDVEEYEETYEEYEEAREDGDDERARELARELDTLADRVNESATATTASSEALERYTGLDFGDAILSIDGTRSDVEATQAEVRAEQFVETELSVTADRDEASFLRPVTLAGTIVDEDGERVSNGTVVVEDGPRTVRTGVENGTFEVEYRPATIAADAEAVPVRFSPDPASAYLASAANASVTIETETPTVRVEDAPESVAFDDEASAAATVAVDGEPVAGVPVELMLGDERLSTGTTDENGSVSLAGTVPANVTAGEQPLVVSLRDEGRALERASGERTVTVEGTPTDLTLRANGSDVDSPVTVTGTLTTDEGDPLAGQRVELTADGATVGTVVTADDGEFAEPIEVGASGDGENVTVAIAAAYDGTETNLEPSEAETTVTLAGVGAGGTGEGSVVETVLETPVLVALAGVVVVLVLALAVGPERIGRLRSVLASPVAGAATVDSDGSLVDEGEPSALDDAASDPVDSSDGIERARDRLDAGEPDDATVLAYEAARQRLSSRLENGDAYTHREFLDASLTAGLDGESGEQLRELTDRYERASFAPTGVEATEAEAAIDLAAALTDS